MTDRRPAVDGPRSTQPRGRWVVLCAVVVVLAAASLALARPGFGDPLTGTPAWRIGAAVALAAMLGLVWVNVLSGQVRLAHWCGAVSLAVAGYWLCGAAASALASDDGAPAPGGGVLVLVASSVAAAGWCLVLALVQASALVAAEEAGLLHGTARARAAIVAAALVVLALALAAPPPQAAPVPRLVPREVAEGPVFSLVQSFVVFGWMLAQLVVPVTVVVLGLRARDTRRRGLVRVAVGASAPVLIILVCGLCAALAGAVGGFRDAEGSGLAIGFCAAVPLALGWLTATVRESTASSPVPLTSIAHVLRAALWLFYVFGVVQVVVLLVPVLRGGAVAGAVATALVLAVTVHPWRLLVRWCVRRADARTAVAEAALAALPHGGDGDASAVRAQRTLQDALGDPSLRVLIARPGERWIDAGGGASVRPEGTAPVLIVADVAGRCLGVVQHARRFVDLRPLVPALRPLFERAAWEAELRAQGERVARERARADAAAEEARRRIERDLHDGVQGRLVSLGLGLGLARETLPDALARDVVDHAVRELQASVAELRELSGGSLGRRLDGHGLASLIGELAARTPLPVHVDVPDTTLPTAVESTVYFVVAEALTNAVKHADPHSVTVRVEVGDVVSVSVGDDGVGGADVRAGTGLRGLGERVQAAGGRLIVSERAPSGTLVEAVLPCVS